VDAAVARALHDDPRPRGPQVSDARPLEEFHTVEELVAPSVHHPYVPVA
jgi:hypothetical protein